MHHLRPVVAKYVIVDVMSPTGGRRLLYREAMDVHIIAAWVLISLEVALLGIQIVEAGVQDVQRRGVCVVVR
jgi:hypothetical protein